MGQDYGPWHALSIEVMGPFPAVQGKQSIISVIVCFSKFTILTAVSQHTAVIVAQVVFNHAISYFGTPERIFSDKWDRVYQPHMGIPQLPLGLKASAQFTLLPSRKFSSGTNAPNL